MIATLRQRDFALLWLGGLISLAGDWVLLIGLPIHVFLLTGSVLATSLMLLAGRIPSVALGSVAGVFVDRWDRKRTLVIANVLMAIGLVPLLLVSAPDRAWIVYVVAFAEACLAQFVSPAQNAWVPELVGEEHIVSANALSSLSGNLARLTGPALGGLVAAWFGLTGLVLVDATSFLVAAVAIGLIASRSAARVGRVAVGQFGSLRRAGSEWIAGLRVIRSERTLTVLVAVFAITGLGEGVFGVLYPVFVNRVLHGAALEIGQLMSAQAVGGLAGGVLVGWAGRRVTSPWVIGPCCVLFGLLDLAIFNGPAFFPSYALTVALFVAVGLPGIAFATGMQSLLQTATPDSFRGRVFGALGTTMGLLGLIGTIAAGTITESLGVVTVLTIQGAAYVVVGILLAALLPRKTTVAVPTQAELA